MSVLEKFQLKDQVAIITGAARGLGLSFAKALADAGASIVIADLDRQAAIKASDEISERGVTSIPVEVDVTKKDQVDAMVDEVIDRFGKIDILFNNAGIVIHEKAEDMTYEQWSKVMDVNLNSVFLVSQAVGKVMIKQNKGTIVNTSSMSGIIVNTPQSQCSYNASKAGVIMLTKSLASEWAPYNIRVNTIAPGYMKTDLTKPFFEAGGEMVERWLDLIPMKRPGTPDELEGIALFLASDASSYVTGSVFQIDGGYTVW